MNDSVFNPGYWIGWVLGILLAFLVNLAIPGSNVFVEILASLVIIMLFSYGGSAAWKSGIKQRDE